MNNNKKINNKESSNDHNDSAKILKNSSADLKKSKASYDSYSTNNSSKLEKHNKNNNNNNNYNNLNSSLRNMNTNISAFNFNSNASFNNTLSIKTSSTATSNLFSNSNNKDNTRFYNKDPKLPYVKLSSDYTLTSKQINRTFINEANMHNFNVKGSEKEEVLVAEKKNFDLLQSLLDCFRSVESSKLNSVYTTIKLASKISEINKMERIIEIEGISGRKEIISIIIENIYQKLKNYGKKIKLVKYQEVNLSFAVKQSKSYSNEKLPYQK